MFESMQVLSQFGFSECFSCFTLWRFRFWAVLIIYSSAKFRRRIPIDIAKYSFVLAFLGSTVETRLMLRSMKALHELHDALHAIDSLVGLVTYLTVLFSFCDFFWELDLLKGRKLSNVLGHSFGHSLRPLMPTNSAWSSTQNNLLLLFLSKPSCVYLQIFQRYFEIFQVFSIMYTYLDRYLLNLGISTNISQNISNRSRYLFSWITSPYPSSAYPSYTSIYGDTEWAKGQQHQYKEIGSKSRWWDLFQTRTKRFWYFKDRIKFFNQNIKLQTKINPLHSKALERLAFQGLGTQLCGLSKHG